MGFSFPEFHSRYRSRIILEWVLRLKVEVGDQYVRRPRKELLQTVSEAFDANHQVLVCGDYGAIKRFIDKITRMRLEAGFPLFHVQRAFELYRMIVLPLLARQAPSGEFLFWTDKINKCLTYTIERFSHHFQSMHEKEILEHNRRLEEEVKARTSELYRIPGYAAQVKGWKAASPRDTGRGEEAHVGEREQGPLLTNYRT